MSQHACLDTCCFECLIIKLYACVLYFCICPCSAQLSMFHMERRSRNMLIIIIIIVIITIIIIVMFCFSSSEETVLSAMTTLMYLVTPQSQAGQRKLSEHSTGFLSSVLQLFFPLYGVMVNTFAPSAGDPGLTCWLSHTSD